MNLIDEITRFNRLHADMVSRSLTGGTMNDLERTKLCAEAMGYAFDGMVWRDQAGRNVGPAFNGYSPLHDDAQAMELVKKFKLEPRYNSIQEEWFVTESYSQRIFAWSEDLNRAIVECVAKMQAERAKP